MLAENWIALPAGIMIASVASSVGIGGGVLWMPFFLIIMGLHTKAAVLTSLLIQTAGMGSGAFTYVQQKEADLKLALFLMVVAIPGILAGAWFTKTLNPERLELILGLLTLTTAFWFVSTSQEYTNLGNSRVEIDRVYRYSPVVMLMAMGSGMLSVSIGEWLIPLLRNKLDLRMTNAVASSIVTIFGTCVVGAIVHLTLGSDVNWRVLCWAVPGVIIGGQIGPRINAKINERMLKEIFIFLLTLVGIHMIYNAF